MIVDVSSPDQHALLDRGAPDPRRAAGESKVFLSTGEANHAARCLYESLGALPPAAGPAVSYGFRFSPA